MTLRSTPEELDEAIPAKQSEEEIWKTLKPMDLVQFSSVFYVGMTVTAVVLGRVSGGTVDVLAVAYCMTDCRGASFA